MKSTQPGLSEGVRKIVDEWWWDTNEGAPLVDEVTVNRGEIDGLLCRILSSQTEEAGKVGDEKLKDRLDLSELGMYHFLRMEMKLEQDVAEEIRGRYRLGIEKLVRFVLAAHPPKRMSEDADVRERDTLLDTAFIILDDNEEIDARIPRWVRRYTAFRDKLREGREG